MFAVLGEIELDLITYLDGWEASFGADYAEHALIEGKPRLQWIGDKLDEIRLELVFHAAYCDPEAELARLRRTMAAHEAQALVLGNGDYKGWFVLTEVQGTARQTDATGALQSLEARLTLREFVGDKTATRLTPGIVSLGGKFPPPRGIVQPFEGADAFRKSLTEAVQMGRRAVGAASAARGAVESLRRLAKGGPGALLKLPGVIGQASGAAQKIVGAVPGFEALAPDVQQAAQAATAFRRAADQVIQGRGILSGAGAENILVRCEQAGRRMQSATGHLDDAARPLAQLAARAALRSG